jgi:hypothetical protein
VPDQHAAFGIAKATRDTREPVWRDLRLDELAGTGVERGQEGGAQGMGPTNVMGANGAREPTQQQPTVGPARGAVGVPVGVRQGMRAIGTNGGAGSALRG